MDVYRKCVFIHLYLCVYIHTYVYIYKKKLKLKLVRMFGHVAENRSVWVEFT